MRPKFLPVFVALPVFALLWSCNENSNKSPKEDIVVKEADTIAAGPSYQLPVPAGWTTEQIIFPIDFAPQILYKGTEELRFARGWEDIASDEHWTYAFLWWLDGNEQINDSILQQHLTYYYDGLVKRNITSRSIPAVKIVPTVVKISTDLTATGDLATYKGNISMLDYIAQQPIILHCIIHVKDAGLPGKTVLFFEVSPQVSTHAVWKTLDDLNKTILIKK